MQRRYATGVSSVAIAWMHRLPHGETRYGLAVRCGLAGRWEIVAWVGGAATAPYRWRGGLRGEKPGFWVEHTGWAEAKKPGFWACTKTLRRFELVDDGAIGGRWNGFAFGLGSL